MSHQPRYVFTVEEMNWQKRRTEHRPPPKPLTAEIPDFERIREHQCDVLVTYDDDIVRALIGRVLYNEIKDTWRVSAIANGGWSVYISVTEITND